MRERIHRTLAALAIFASALPVSGIAQTAGAMGNGLQAANRVRTFFASLGPAVGVSPDAVHFNAALAQLVVCEGGNPAKCSSTTLRARDVVPMRNAASDGHSLLVIRGTGDYRLCDVSSSSGSLALSCAGVSGSELAGFKGLEAVTRSTIIRTAGARATDEYQCGLTPKFGLLCSSAQRLQEREGALLFGSFNGAGTQVVSLSSRGNRICDVGGSCREAAGLDSLLGAGQVGASGRLLEGQDKAAIFGVAAALQSACVQYVSSSTAVAFHCEQVATDGGDDARTIYSVHSSGGEARDFIAFGAKQASPSGQARPDLNSWRSQSLKEVTERANLGAGGKPSRRLQMFSSLDEGEWSMRYTATGGIHITPLLYEAYGGPNQLLVMQPDQNLEFWTDTWGYDNFLDMLRLVVELGPMPRTECLAECDRQKMMRDDSCDVMGGIVFALGEGATIGVSIGVAFSGPGAVGVFATGTLASLSVAQGYAFLCKSGAAQEHKKCVERCPLS